MVELEDLNSIGNGLGFTSCNKCAEQSTNKDTKTMLKESSLFMNSRRKLRIIKVAQYVLYFPIPEALLSNAENVTNIN